MDRDGVCVLLPAYQEAATVGDVVREFQEAGYHNVLVVDGGSTDGTRELAREAGARVVVQSGSGKGQAIREAMERYVSAEYVLLADADATYQAGDADRMVRPLFEGVDHVIGDRYGDMREGAMTRFNHLGNRIFNWLFRLIHGADFEDILSGYRAFSADSFDRLRLRADGFGIETEMAVEAARRGQRVQIVPITYTARPDGSSTNLHPVKDGWIILAALYRRAKTANPLFYFGSAGTALGIAGVAIEAFVAYDWFFNRISHEVLAVSGGILLVLAVQFVVFGVLSDLIASLHAETIDRLDDLEARLDDAQRAPDSGAVSETNSATASEGETTPASKAETSPTSETATTPGSESETTQASETPSDQRQPDEQPPRASEGEQQPDPGE